MTEHGCWPVNTMEALIQLVAGKKLVAKTIVSEIRNVSFVVGRNVNGLFRVVQYCAYGLLELHSTRNKHPYHGDLKYHKCEASWIFTGVIEH